ncbi:hypothetical protein HXX76_013504 [Chlamydomonas incerta]|uniref:Uncharacterized protein n=1 Tax=Chlamydomonas incerta TaxID=51695 RepID=A0A835STM8_CHLIN|nr:hypothetical protein HXX76_013504 [Chlamydomonas incerta]|eukprot:KAG2425661.1 hypothetical protein HXX76_013504 [Chlamydomonas incerta]
MAPVAHAHAVSSPSALAPRCRSFSARPAPSARGTTASWRGAAARPALAGDAAASARSTPLVHAPASTPQPSAIEASRGVQGPAAPPGLAPELRSLLLSAAASLPGTLLAAAACSAAELSAAAPVAPPAAAAMVFEPQAPDASVLAAQALVLLLTAGAGAYWWYVVVPTERAAVGRSKRLGALNSYLGELEAPQATQERKLERWFYTDWLQQREKRRQRLGKPAAPAAASASSASASPSGNPNPEDPYIRENAPYNDDLLRPTVDTPTPRFLSLDNPLVATAALLTAVGVVSTLLHGQ